MKIQVMQLGKGGEGAVVPDYEAKGVWEVLLVSYEGELVIKISERGDGFAIRSTNASISVLPEADNAIHIIRRPSAIYRQV